jgi:co-chaperonin GroES (HSP10)
MTTIRLMRGQVAVREIYERGSNTLWTPTPTDGRNMKTHRGIVLGVGAPALMYGKVEVPLDFQVGDIIQYHFNHHKEAATIPWSDGEPATWIPQESVDAVIEEASN